MKRFNTNWTNKEQVPVVIIFGPTAVGKTQLISRLADANVEIINADSMQVYKYMDVGTAKPEPLLRRKIPHHLIDILKPSCQFTAGNFVRESEKLIPQIYHKRKIPIICGGTAFYIRSFVYGLPNSPRADKKIRTRLQAEYALKGKDSLFAELTVVDPQSAETINPNDTYRIKRALEVYRTTGKPLSAFPPPAKIRSDFRLLLLGLEREKKELYARIEKRVDWMFEHDLLAEIKRLMALGYNENDPGMRGIGYKEFFEMQKGCLDLEDIKDRIKQNSRKFAKRQITFFNGLHRVKWFPADEPEQIMSAIKDFTGLSQAT